MKNGNPETTEQSPIKEKIKREYYENLTPHRNR